MGKIEIMDAFKIFIIRMHRACKCNFDYKFEFIINGEKQCMKSQYWKD